MPDWASGDEARPVIASTGITPFDFSNPGGAIHQEGVVVSGLDLTCTDCAGSAASGVFISNDVDHVLLEDLQIRGFEIGIHQGGSNACDPSDASCDGKNTDLTVRDVTIEQSTVIGMLAGGDRLAILDSVFRENGSGSVFHHNLYVSSPSGSSADVRIERNTLYRSAWLANGTCEGTSLVVHGVQSGLQIRDNLVYEDIGSATEACWGITVDAAYSDAERFEDVSIAGNRVLNVGNLGIGVSSCVGCTLRSDADPDPTDDTASGTESGADSEEQAGKGSGCAVASSATGAGFWGLFAVALRRRSESEHSPKPNR